MIINIENLNNFILILFLFTYFSKLIFATQQKNKRLINKIFNSWILNLIALFLIIFYFVLKFIHLNEKVIDLTLNSVYTYITIFLLIFSIIIIGFIYGFNTFKKYLINFKTHSILAEIEVNKTIDLFNSVNHFCINILALTLISLEYTTYSITNKFTFNNINDILNILATSILFIGVIDGYQINYKKLKKPSSNAIFALSILIYINYISFVILYEKYQNILSMAFILHSILLLSYFFNISKIINFNNTNKFENDTDLTRNTIELPIFTTYKEIHHNRSDLRINLVSQNPNSETLDNKTNTSINLINLKNISQNKKENKLSINKIKIR